MAYYIYVFMTVIVFGRLARMLFDARRKECFCRCSTDGEFRWIDIGRHCGHISVTKLGLLQLDLHTISLQLTGY